MTRVNITRPRLGSCSTSHQQPLGLLWPNN